LLYEFGFQLLHELVLKLLYEFEFIKLVKNINRTFAHNVI